VGGEVPLKEGRPEEEEGAGAAGGEVGRERGARLEEEEEEEEEGGLMERPPLPMPPAPADDAAAAAAAAAAGVPIKSSGRGARASVWLLSLSTAWMRGIAGTVETVACGGKRAGEMCGGKGGEGEHSI
jgi:hypothetical protein